MFDLNQRMLVNLDVIHRINHRMMNDHMREILKVSLPPPILLYLPLKQEQELRRLLKEVSSHPLSAVVSIIYPSPQFVLLAQS